MDASQRALIAEYDELLSASSPPQGGSEQPSEWRSPPDEQSPRGGEEDEIVRVEAAVFHSQANDDDEATPRAEVPYPSSYQPSGAASSLRSSGLDSDNLSLILDEDCNKLKRDVMEFFLSAKGKLMEHEAHAVERERREWMRIIHSKQDEIDVLNDKNARKDSQVKRLTVQLLRAAEFRASSVTRAEDLRIKLVALTAWKQHAKHSRELKHKLKMWMVHNTKTYVMGSVFKAWRSAVHHELHVNLNNRLEAAMEAERNRVRAEQASFINNLHAEVDELNYRLQKEQESRKALEEQMKKAFMRGVCALNLEAMNLMKTGHPPGGVNPFSADPADPRAAAVPEGNENLAPVYHRAAMLPSDMLGAGAPAEALMERQQLQQETLQAAAAAEASAAPLEQGSASAALERFLAQVNRVQR